MHIFITGVAGFIGANAANQLLAIGHRVTGIDNLNDYYDPQLKKDRLQRLEGDNKFQFVKGNIQDRGVLAGLFADGGFDAVIHMAAQAGVRYSIDNPRSYLDSNLVGTFELLEAARANPPKHMLLASTSSAYGANTEMPYQEVQKADHQMSFYAATKKATEAMAHSYAHLYALPITMFRFFTVYGPWGRPDMAPIKFARKIIDGTPIDVYNHGNMRRDFTYVDDLVRALTLLLDKAPTQTPIADVADSLSPVAPFRVVNIGNNKPVELLDFISEIEIALGKQAVQNLMEMQAGDVAATWADTALLEALTGYVPRTDIKIGVKAFVDWYQSYYG
ncbi:MAG: NAD-dependent epimerase/dehydratase family protein [Marinovum sp.]|nr:NAD-dependent epimerase/dehydratase family protein [Marinovum sp.]MBT6506189.1 NAD-dependent epimerase/dehydratase family protein [Marinovum sp.]MBT7907029.1 NAD-dependent epimerase/dehydratase family protein [Marinovum sp.]